MFIRKNKRIARMVYSGYVLKGRKDSSCRELEILSALAQWAPLLEIILL